MRSDRSRCNRSADRLNFYADYSRSDTNPKRQRGLDINPTRERGNPIARPRFRVGLVWDRPRASDLGPVREFSKILLKILTSAANYSPERGRSVDR